MSGSARSPTHPFQRISRVLAPLLGGVVHNYIESTRVVYGERGRSGGEGKGKEGGMNTDGRHVICCVVGGTHTVLLLTRTVEVCE